MQNMNSTSTPQSSPSYTLVNDRLTAGYFSELAIPKIHPSVERNELPVRLPSLTETFPELFNRRSCPSDINYSIPLVMNPLAQLRPTPPRLHPVHFPYNRVNSFEQEVYVKRNYSFIALNERDRKPRPRRRYEEVERLYPCIHQGCNKSYGALNHLNSHIVSKGHGQKRSPQEFQDLRYFLKKRDAESATSQSPVQVLPSYSQFPQPSRALHSHPYPSPFNRY